VGESGGAAVLDNSISVTACWLAWLVASRLREQACSMLGQRFTRKMLPRGQLEDNSRTKGQAPGDGPRVPYTLNKANVEGD